MEKKPSFLERLQKLWKLKDIKQTILVLITFACGGSLCGFLGGKILGLLAFEHVVLKTIAYFVVMTIIWPFCVLGMSIIFGQYTFFRNYIYRMIKRLTGKKTKTESKEGN